MAKETIEAVRNAELEAQKIEKTAEAKGDELISNAKKQALEILESTTSDAHAQAKKLLEEAQINSRDWQAYAAKETEEEIKQLKGSAAQKESEVIRLVMSQIV